MIFRSKSKIPGWFVALAVLVTAGLTAWAIFRKSGGTWPDQAGMMPMQVARTFSPAMAAMDPGGFQKVAATRPVPVIQAGATPKHADRGACTLCHVVVDTLGKVIPSIQVMAGVPHDYRGGLCINCHTVGTAKMPAPGGGAFGALAAGQAAPQPGGLTPAVAAPPASALPPAAIAAPRRQPSEGAWLGMEVVPITRLTAGQYGIPANLRGLVVAEAEADAATAGIQAGDVVVAINGIPISDMQSFLQATQNGTQNGGAVTLMRQGRFVKQVLGQAPAAANNAAQPQAAMAPSPGMQPVAGAPVAAPRYGAGAGTGSPFFGVGGQGIGQGFGQGFGRGPGQGPGQGLGQGNPAMAGGTCPNGFRR